jgi:hypothetical protein
LSTGALRKADIERLLRELNTQLEEDGVRGELYLVGGAVMCLAHNARAATRDLDGLFRPAKQVRAAAAKVAIASNLPETWLNDAVKGFFSERGSFSVYFELPNLTVFVADPAYLLAMKCLSARIGAEFHDIDDVRYLLRYLNITTVAEATKSLESYYPLARFPQKTTYLLEELLTNATMRQS